MQYYNLGRRRLISDIFSPFDRYGFKIRHPYVKDKPIGTLDRQYRQRYKYDSPPAKANDIVKPTRRHFSIVPPMTVLHDEFMPSNHRSTAGKIVAFTSLAWLGLRRSLAGAYGFRYRLAVPVLLLLLGLLVLWAQPNPAIHHNPPAIQLFPSSRAASLSNPAQAVTGGSHNGGTSNSSSGSTNLSGTSTTSGLTGGTTSSSSGGTVVGGRGGGPTGATSSPSGALPLYLQIPPTNLGADGKTILNTSGSQIQVN